MPGFNVEVDHTLGQEAAVERLKGLLDKIAEHYKDTVKNVEQSWTDNVLNFSFKTLGMTIGGKMTVDEDKAKIDGKLPIAAMAFRGQIEKSIREELQKRLR